MWEEMQVRTENEKNRELKELRQETDIACDKLHSKEADLVKMTAELNFLRTKQHNTIENLERQTDQLEKETIRMRYELSNKNAEIQR